MKKIIPIEVNLQQTLFWTGDENVVNAICAVYQKGIDVLFITAGYQSMQSEIKAACTNMTPLTEVTYIDSWHIDTWDARINKRQVIYAHNRQVAINARKEGYEQDALRDLHQESSEAMDDLTNPEG